MKKTIFSGIQPSGNLHIGNYIGALSQWKALQDAYESYFCIVDLHAVTVSQNPEILRKNILETAALYIACGVDPEKSTIFIQSENSNHPYLSWLLNCITPFGQLSRMTQFKDKSQKQADNTTAGLFDYPVLMAADILLYGTDEVPVGEDQKQHIELTRDIAEKFNKTFGQTFTVPSPRIPKETARIMSLQNPTSKMSKSDADANGAIFLLDTPDEVRTKIKRAVTDSGSEISANSDKPALSNLLSIYSSVSGKSVQDLEMEYEGKGYGDFKNGLADAVVEFLAPIQKKYHELMNDPSELNKILNQGREKAIQKSNPVVSRAKDAMGLLRT